MWIYTDVIIMSIESPQKKESRTTVVSSNHTADPLFS